MTTAKISLVIILIISLFVPVSLIVADQEEYTNFTSDVLEKSLINGRPWLKLDLQSRIMYLSGLEDGAALLIAEMGSVQNEKDNARAAFPAYKRLTITGFRFSDITEEINRFYEQASNQRIPVVDAYRYVLKKFKGASPEELASAQSALRKKYNR